MPTSEIRPSIAAYGRRGMQMSMLLALALAVCSCDDIEMSTPAGRLRHAENELSAANSPAERFYALGDAAKTAFEAGQYGKAKDHASELERLAPKYPHDWNYGNAIQDFNVVQGRLALRDGKVDEAKAHLLAAGRSPGSPQMNSFGPNMSLANDLLQRGERDTVLQYFELCRKFWSFHKERLDAWSTLVQAGKIPDFGANLVY
jgi:predicted Zn-dependent protease